MAVETRRTMARRKSCTATEQTHHRLQSLHALLSSFQSPQGLTTKNLERLYGALVFLSSSKSLDFSESKLKCKEIAGLSDVLFGELESRFKGLFSALDVKSAGPNDELGLGFGVRMEDLTLLLRCCMVVLIFVASDQKLLMEKCRILLEIIRRLISVELSGGTENDSVIFKSCISRENQCVGKYCTVKDAEEFVASVLLMKPSNPCCTLICAFLEVIADELLAHKLLRGYLKLDDTASSTKEILLTYYSQLGNIGTLLQMITAHFMLSVSDEKGFVNFFHNLFWCYEGNHRIPEMSLSSALSFLANPVVSAAPKILQAHLILMVSEAVGICQPPVEKMSLTHVDYYLQAFESSLILYGRHVSCLHINNCSSEDDSLRKMGSLGRSGLLISESFMQSFLRDKLHFLISRLNDSLDSYSSAMFSNLDSDIVAASILYVKASMHFFDKSYRDEIFAFMSMIIMMTRCSSDDCGVSKLQRDGKLSAHNVYLLASILKLMSCSLLQVSERIRHLMSSSCLSSKDTYACKLYDVVVNIINPFKDFSVHLPINEVLRNLVQSLLGRHKVSKGMLLHFLGFLSLSYASELDFLVKDCLFLLMALMNFFSIDESVISALKSVLAARLELSFPESQHNSEPSLVVYKPSQMLSSKARRTVESYMRTRLQVYSEKRIQEHEAEILKNTTFQNRTDACSDLEGFRGTCNGEVYLKCAVGTPSQADIDELADFIVCSEGKDYHGWLRSRERFREWKYKKTKILRWKRKKTRWSRLRK